MPPPESTGNSDTMRKSVGVDIGGTKTAVAAVDSSGRMHAQTTFETRSDQGFAVGLKSLSATIQRVLDEARWSVDEIDGIGIGCAGPVNPIRGIIQNPYTLPGWEDANIVAELGQRFGIRVILENDADAAAVGEYQFGAGRNASSMVMITVGTGIGGAALLNGKIHRGINGEHPELGHIPIFHDGPDCYCGIKGCWESIASGTAIGLSGKSFDFEDSRAVFEQMTKDDRAANIINRAVKSTAIAAWTLIHTFLPEKIIFGGGIGEAHFELFAGAMREHVKVATQVSGKSVHIVKAELGQRAGVIGGAALAFQSANPY
jgi:glucokinase